MVLLIITTGSTVLRPGVFEPCTRHSFYVQGLKQISASNALCMPPLYGPHLLCLRPTPYPAYHWLSSVCPPCPGTQNQTPQNPTIADRGVWKMIQISDRSRQPPWKAWTMEWLNTKLTINLGVAIDCSTHNSYTSTLNSYLTFCNLHNLDIEPTCVTLHSSSFSSQQSSTQNLSIHIFWALPTSLRHISLMCGLCVKMPLLPMLWRVPSTIMVSPQPESSH